MKKNALILITLTLGIVSVLLSCKQAEDAVVDTYLKAVAKQVNQKGSIMSDDKEIRSDSVSIKPGRTMVYNYTLVNYSKIEVDTNYAKGNIEPNARKAVSTSPQMKGLRDKDVNFEYIYRDKNKKYAFSFVIKASEYKNKK